MVFCLSKLQIKFQIKLKQLWNIYRFSDDNPLADIKRIEDKNILRYTLDEFCKLINK